MCIILTAEQDRPSEALIARATEVNRDGNGLAWREAGRVDFLKDVLALALETRLAPRDRRSVVAPGRLLAPARRRETCG